MDVPGFSKVGDLLEDEEDERRHLVAAAAKRYAGAQEAFGRRASHEEVLRLFEEAEGSMAELVRGGLAGLAPQELEMVLKGRLHMAVVVAQMPEQHRQWPKVRSLVEDVLQFDFNNCHARWLRGLALLHGPGGATERAKAEEEMRAAARSARATGKAEAAQWEAEIERSFAEEASESRKDPSATNGASAAEGAGEANPVAATHGNTGRERSPGPALQKGFFNRPRAAARTRSSGPAGSAQAASSAPSAGSSPAVAPAVSSRDTAAELEAARRELVELREAAALTSAEAERRYSKELEELRAQVREAERLRERAMEESRHGREQVGLCGQELRELEAELETLLPAGAPTRATGAAAEGDEGLEELRAAAEELAGRLRDGRLWAEAEHQKYVNCATEVSTLREMTTRELRERRTASRQLVDDVKGLGQKMGDLKATVKVLRDNVRKLGGSSEDNSAAPDLPRLAADAADFRGLPRAVKIQALLDDAAMLRLLAAAFLGGALLVLAGSVEAFGIWRCRFVCAR